MRTFRDGLVAVFLASFVLGCGGAGEKGANKDLDRPIPTRKPAKPDSKAADAKPEK